MHIAIIGTGNMGRALIDGLIASEGTAVRVSACDVREEALQVLPSTIVRFSAADPGVLKSTPDIVVLAVKPADIGAAIAPLASAFQDRKSGPLWMSIAAGITISSIASFLPGSAKICRVMPNTPALIGEGISAFALSDRCGDPERELAARVLRACGRVLEVPEKMMDAVTGLSGSGPAYVYSFIEALIEGGVASGLTYATARELAVQTVIGAARMVDTGNEGLSDLRARVMSPGGTTVRGIMALEEGGFKHAVMRAVTQATERAGQLGKT